MGGREGAWKIVILILALCLTATTSIADWTCGICGRTFPVNRGHSTYDDYWIQLHLGSHQQQQPPPPPDPLVTLSAEYQTLRSEIAGTGLSLPPARYPHTLEELAETLDQLHRWVVDRNRLLARENEKHWRQLAELRRQIEANTRTSATIRQEIAGLQNSIDDARLRRREISIKLAGVRAELSAMRRALDAIEEETESYRRSLYASLAIAQKRGLIQPPSSYREPPRPPSPIFERQEWPVGNGPDLATAIDYSPGDLAKAAIDSDPHLPPPFNPTPLDASEAAIRRSIGTIRASALTLQSMEAVKSEHERERRTVEAEAALSSWSVEALSRTRDKLREIGLKAGEELRLITQKLQDDSMEAIRLRRQFPYSLVERSLWKWYDGRTKRLLRLAAGPGLNTKIVFAFRKVMIDVGKLGADTLKVVGRLPEAVTGEPGAVDELQRDIDSAIQRFKVSLFYNLTGAPKDITDLFPKEATQ